MPIRRYDLSFRGPLFPSKLRFLQQEHNVQIVLYPVSVIRVVLLFTIRVQHVTNNFNGLTSWTLNLIETPFNTFANRADPDQTALERANRADPDQTALERAA